MTGSAISPASGTAAESQSILLLAGPCFAVIAIRWSLPWTRLRRLLGEGGIWIPAAWTRRESLGQPDAHREPGLRSESSSPSSCCPKAFKNSFRPPRCNTRLLAHDTEPRRRRDTRSPGARSIWWWRRWPWFHPLVYGWVARLITRGRARARLRRKRAGRRRRSQGIVCRQASSKSAASIFNPRSPAPRVCRARA